MPLRLDLLLLITTTVLSVAALDSRGEGREPHRGPTINDAFWDHWGDGRAELGAYDLVIPRYGELRRGVAVTIFVTETFSEEARVKANPGRHQASDEYPVMKLNFVQDFPTGIYDYNLMTSAFLALAPRSGRPPGTPAKEFSCRPSTRFSGTGSG